MNISPTPKRYNSRAREYPLNMEQENYHPYNYDFPRMSNINNNHNNNNPVTKDPLPFSNDKIVPEEYKINSQMINKLIRQNRELVNKLETKQEEIDRLNVLVGSLRGKLIKYTELNKKLQEDLQRGNHNTTASTEETNDYIQLPKTRRQENNDDRISEIYEKLDRLTKLVVSGQQPTLSPLPSPPSVKQHTRATTTSARVTDTDIMCQESAELKELEDQIDGLKRKLLIKRENELRKLSLNKELLDLMGKLDLSSPSLPRNSSIKTEEEEEEEEHDHSKHCQECHRKRGAEGLANGIPRYTSAGQALETPTPLNRYNPKNTGSTDTTNKATLW